jgi:hypothetical protein
MSFFAAVPWSSRASEGEGPGRPLREAGGLEAMRRPPIPDLEGPDFEGDRPIPGRAGFASPASIGSSAGFELLIGARPGLAAGRSTAFEFVLGFAVEFVGDPDVLFVAALFAGATLFVRAGGAGDLPTVRRVVLAVDPPLAAALFGTAFGAVEAFGDAFELAPAAAFGFTPPARRAFSARRFASQSEQRMRSEVTSVRSREGVNVAPQDSQMAMSGGSVSDLAGGTRDPRSLVQTFLERWIRRPRPRPGGLPEPALPPLNRISYQPTRRKGEP